MLILLAAALCAFNAAHAAGPAFRDPTAPIERRVADLLSRMTLEEKSLELFHNNTGIDRVGIPDWAGWNQCIHGVWSRQATTCFPAPIAMAATWDPALLHTVADAISDEARALYNLDTDGPHGKQGLVYRAPVINLSRDPRWGRIQECYGEDPYLTGRMAVAFVQGLQGSDPKYLKVAATLKHFAANNQERGRTALSADVPERVLHEYWLPHFKAAVVEGHVRSVMAAYNAVNGTPCAVNKLLLTDILRKQWGFDGFVVCDLGGISHCANQQFQGKYKIEEVVARAMLAGCDYDDQEYRDVIPKAVRAGLLSVADVDRSLARVLRVAFQLGVFDPPALVPFTHITPEVIDSPAHRQLARQTEREAIVLLVNRDHFLPLEKSRLKSIALIGPLVQRPTYGNYYNYHAAARLVAPLDAFRALASARLEVGVARGCGMLQPKDPERMAEAVALAKRSDVAIVVVGTDGSVEGEGKDRESLALPGAQEELIKAVYEANPRTVVVLNCAGPLAIAWAKEHVPAILQVWYPGEEGGSALVDVIFGDCNPAGRLPYTIYASTAQLPPQTEYDITKGFTYMYLEKQPLFPFGFGLSYTEFRYGNLRLSADHLTPTGQLTVSIDLENVGPLAGDEVPQLYVHAVHPSVKRPIKELRGFARIALAPGEKQTVRFVLPAASLAFYDIQRHAMAVEPGQYEIMVGSSSADIRAKATVVVAE